MMAFLMKIFRIVLALVILAYGVVNAAQIRKGYAGLFVGINLFLLPLVAGLCFFLIPTLEVEIEEMGNVMIILVGAFGIMLPVTISMFFEMPKVAGFLNVCAIVVMAATVSGVVSKYFIVAGTVLITRFAMIVMLPLVLLCFGLGGIVMMWM